MSIGIIFASKVSMQGLFWAAKFDHKWRFPWGKSYTGARFPGKILSRGRFSGGKDLRGEILHHNTGTFCVRINGVKYIFILVSIVHVIVLAIYQ